MAKRNKVITPLPKRLKHAREKNNKISQLKLGLAIGIDDPVRASVKLNQYEAGMHMPKYPTLEAIAKCLNYPLSYFYEENDGRAALLELVKDFKQPRLDLLKELIEATTELNNPQISMWVKLIASTKSLKPAQIQDIMNEIANKI